LDGVPRKKILIIDEKKIHQVLSMRLKLTGYEVILSHSSRTVPKILETQAPDLIILDLRISNIKELQIHSKIQNLSQNPTIILTTLNKVSNCLKDLEYITSDYIQKPVSLKKLEKHIKSLIFHADTKFTQTFTVNENIDTYNLLSLNKTKQYLKIKLTSTEFRILKLLVRHSGEKLTRTYILQNVWGYIPERDADKRVIDVYISRLRFKLEISPQDPKFIKTLRGNGYVFQKN
jgi:DNA-binding response OmpR family regulator